MVNYSIWFVTMALATGGTAESPAVPSSPTVAVLAAIPGTAPAPGGQNQAPNTAPASPQKRGLLSHLADWFGCRKRQPSPPNGTSDPGQTTALKPSVAAPAGGPTDLKPTYQKRIGHEADYSWVTGQLYYLHADSGIWVVRYASVEEEDRYGGSVVLAGGINMKNFREGDLVSVHGEVLDEGRASKHLGGPLYRASSVDLVERSDP